MLDERDESKRSQQDIGQGDPDIALSPIKNTNGNAPVDLLKQRYRRVVRFVLLGSVGVVCASSSWLGYRAWLDAKSQQLNQDCRLAMRSGDLDRLDSLASAWCDRDPASAFPWLYRADVAEKRGDFDRAVELLGRVPATTPQAVSAFVEKAKLEFGAANHVLNGVETTRRILQLDRRSPDAHTLLIAFYGMTFQRTELLTQIHDAIRLRCEPREAYTYLIIADNLSFTNGAQTTERWRLGAPQSELLHVAWALHLAKNAIQMAVSRPNAEHKAIAEEADFQINEFAKRYPDNPALLEHLMSAAVDNGDQSGLAQLLRRVPKTRGSDYIFWRYRGWYHAAKGELGESELAYRQALSLNPLSWRTRFEFAGVLRRLDRKIDLESWEKLALQGKDLHNDILKLANMRDVPNSLLFRVAAYAEACGDRNSSESLYRRLQGMWGASGTQ